MQFFGGKSEIKKSVEKLTKLEAAQSRRSKFTSPLRLRKNDSIESVHSPARLDMSKDEVMLTILKR